MKKLIGKIVNGNGAASERFRLCKEVLKEYGINFPPLHFGTINIKLNEEYKTPNKGVIIPYDKLDDISRMNKEYWRFIPILKVNGKKRLGYILRTSINIHGDKVIELLVEHIDIEIKDNKIIEVEIDE